MTEPLRVERDGYGDRYLTCNDRHLDELSPSEADAIEAQLAGPDLTELREAVASYNACGCVQGEPCACLHRIADAARRLVGGTGGNL